MTKRDPLKLYSGLSSMETMNGMLKRSQRRPRIGVTQGGSSRKNSGARVAATTAKFRKTRP